MEYQYQILNIENENEICEYEKILFKTYTVNKNILMDYYEIKNERMKLKNISYNDLINYVTKFDNKIIAGMTMHINSENEFILEKMGFKIDRNSIVCEGLTTFVDERYEKDKMEILFKLSDLLIYDIKNRGFKIVYGTTPAKYKNLHALLFNAEIIECKRINGENRALIKNTVY